MVCIINEDDGEVKFFLRMKIGRRLYRIRNFRRKALNELLNALSMPSQHILVRLTVDTLSFCSDDVEQFSFEPMK